VSHDDLFRHRLGGPEYLDICLIEVFELFVQNLPGLVPV
jgi:hypothetical protein